MLWKLIFCFFHMKIHTKNNDSHFEKNKSKFFFKKKKIGFLDFVAMVLLLITIWLIWSNSIYLYPMSIFSCMRLHQKHIKTINRLQYIQDSQNKINIIIINFETCRYYLKKELMELSKYWWIYGHRKWTLKMLIFIFTTTLNRHYLHHRVYGIDHLLCMLLMKILLHNITSIWFCWSAYKAVSLVKTSWLEFSCNDSVSWPGFHLFYVW